MENPESMQEIWTEGRGIREAEDDTLDLDINIVMNMGFLLPAGFVVGTIIVLIFDYKTTGWNMQGRRAKFQQLTKNTEPVHPSIQRRLANWVDGPWTMGAFWGGAVLNPKKASKEMCAKNYGKTKTFAFAAC